MEITEKEYKRLKLDSLMLEALTISGVNSWEWYSEALETYRDLVSDHSKVKDDLEDVLE